MKIKCPLCSAEFEITKTDTDSLDTHLMSVMHDELDVTQKFTDLLFKIHEELELFETARQTPINKDVASHQDRVIQILKSLLENEK